MTRAEQTHAGSRPAADRLRWRVLKFGGTSVTGPDKVDVIARIVGRRSDECRPLVVVSALAEVTSALREAASKAASGSVDEPLAELAGRHVDGLSAVVGDDALARERIEELLEELGRLLHGAALVGECSPRTLDHLLSVGERMSTVIVAAGLESRGIAARAEDAAEWIVTDDHHGGAEVDFAATRARLGATSAWNEAVPVMTGFLGASADGVRTTLGPGGSDYSAAVLGWAIDAEEVEIWTDVDGVMTSDPRTVPEARPLRGLGFNELLELSHWGARVVHPKTVRPLRERGIPLSIRNTLAPDGPGTMVGPQAKAFSSGPVRGIASIDRVALMQLSGFGYGGGPLAARFLGALEEARCPVLLMSQGCSERSVAVALAAESLDAARRAVREAFVLERKAGLLDDPIIEEGCSIVAVVGEGMKDHPGIAGRIFGVLGEVEVNVRAIAQGSSELSLSFVVHAEDVRPAIQAIHRTYFPRPVSEPERLAAEVAVRVGPDGRQDVVELARNLVAIPSVSGEEQAITEVVRHLLEASGWRVTLQEVSAGRANLWATRGQGDVTLSTHLDTVPGFLPPRVRDGRLYGRGSCDAKGIAAAMIIAANRLAAEGEERVDLLFVVGEEARSDGARIARVLPATSRFLVNGEPTESRLVSASKGSQQLRVATTGQEAHSAYAELGDSAIVSMMRLLSELDGLDLPVDDELGDTTVNVGVIRGGSAPNVVPGECSAQLMVRLVGETEEVRAHFDDWAEGRAQITWGSHVPAQRFRVLDDFDTTTVAYVSDVAFLSRWGEPLMFGPGSIHVAHTPREHVSLSELRASVDAYERIVRSLLGS